MFRLRQAESSPPSTALQWAAALKSPSWYTDLIIASENAMFALPEPRVGLAALAGGLQRLPRQIGLKRAMGMILTARHVSAREGHELGFVNEVVPQGEVLAAAERWAETICKNSPMSIRASKQAIQKGLAVSLEQAITEQREYPAVKAMAASQDYIEGPKAFSSDTEMDGEVKASIASPLLSLRALARQSELKLRCFRIGGELHLPLWERVGEEGSGLSIQSITLIRIASDDAVRTPTRESETELTAASLRAISNNQITSDTPSRSRGSIRPSFSFHSGPLPLEGAGRCRVHAAPAVSWCNYKGGNAHTSIQVQPEAIRHSLRNGFTVFPSRSPR